MKNFSAVQQRTSNPNRGWADYIRDGCEYQFGEVHLPHPQRNRLIPLHKLLRDSALELAGNQRAGGVKKFISNFWLTKEKRLY